MISVRVFNVTEIELGFGFYSYQGDRRPTTNVDILTDFD